MPCTLRTPTLARRARPPRARRLNTLLGRLTGADAPPGGGFKVSPTQHSCTRGLWMWSEPIPATDAAGKPCNVVRGAAAGPGGGGGGTQGRHQSLPLHDPPHISLPPNSSSPPGSTPASTRRHPLAPSPPPLTPPLRPQLLIDCEGIDAVDQGAKHSAQIFSLAVLLSAVFVFNQVRCWGAPNKAWCCVQTGALVGWGGVGWGTWRGLLRGSAWTRGGPVPWRR